MSYTNLGMRARTKEGIGANRSCRKASSQTEYCSLAKMSFDASFGFDHGAHPLFDTFNLACSKLYKDETSYVGSGPQKLILYFLFLPSFPSDFNLIKLLT